MVNATFVAKPKTASKQKKVSKPKAARKQKKVSKAEGCRKAEGMPDWRKEFLEKSKLYAELAKHPWKPVEKHIGLNVTGVSHVYFAVTKKELEAGIHPNMHFTDGRGIQMGTQVKNGNLMWKFHEHYETVGCGS